MIVLLLLKVGLVITAVGSAGSGPLQSQCTVTADPPSVERYGGDYKKVSLVGSQASFEHCGALCCADTPCRAFSFNNISCGAGGVWCCQLKNQVHGLANNTYNKVRTGVVAGKPAPPPPPPPPLPPSGPWPVPPFRNSAFISSTVIGWDNPVMTHVSGDTWPSTWADSGQTYAMGCDNKQPGYKEMAFMNWWANKNSNGNSTVVGGGTGSSTSVDLRLVNNAPISTPDVYAICGKYFNNQRAAGNIKPTSVIAVGQVLYAAVQCIKYNDGTDTSFKGRQRGFNAWIITSADG
eukprot:gene17614-6133_t